MTDVSVIPPAAPSPAIESCKRDQIELILVLSAVGLLALVIILVFALVFLKITPDAVVVGIVMTLVTAVIGLAGTAFGYFLGSSKGSQAKSDQIAAIAKPTPSTTPPQA